MEKNPGQMVTVFREKGGRIDAWKEKNLWIIRNNWRHQLASRQEVATWLRGHRLISTMAHEL
jgi:hypothetical protein